MERTLTTSILAVIALGSLTACKKVKDAIDGDPQDSYCEALCDWATTCVEGGSLDAGTAAERCDEATHEADASCTDAEGGSLSPDDSILLTECTDAVAAMDCAALNGGAVDQAVGVPPAACAVSSGGTDSLSTYNSARGAVKPNGDEMCEDFVGTICSKAVTCLIGDFGITEAEEALQGACESALGAWETNCKDTGMFDFSSPNRTFADSCLADIEAVDACGIFGADAYSADCASAAGDLEQIANLATSLLAFADSAGVSAEDLGL